MTFLRRSMLAAIISTIALGVVVAPPSVHADDGADYTVVFGDSWYGIANAHGVSVSSLLRVNGREITSMLWPGQHLELPEEASPSTGGAPGSGSSSGGSYSVVFGDSWYGIANAHGVSVSSLLRANGREITSMLWPGQRLQLPAGAVASASAPAPSSGNSQTDAVVDYVRQQVGKPYRFFTKGPEAFDCSGLALAAYAQVGVPLVHYSAAQAQSGRAVDLTREAIAPGDLVFQQRHGSAMINHVGIAVSSTLWVQATGPGDAVRIGRLPSADQIAAVRRLIDA